MTYAFWCIYSERGGILRVEIKITEELKTIIKKLDICLQIKKNKRRSLVVAYVHVTKRVANVKNGINTPDNHLSRIEKSKCHMIQVMHSFVENYVIFLIAAYYKFTLMLNLRLRVNPIMTELLLYGKNMIGIKTDTHLCR